MFPLFLAGAATVLAVRSYLHRKIGGETIDRSLHQINRANRRQRDRERQARCRNINRSNVNMSYDSDIRPSLPSVHYSEERNQSEERDQLEERERRQYEEERRQYEQERREYEEMDYDRAQWTNEERDMAMTQYLEDDEEEYTMALRKRDASGIYAQSEDEDMAREVADSQSKRRKRYDPTSYQSQIDGVENTAMEPIEPMEVTGTKPERCDPEYVAQLEDRIRMLEEMNEDQITARGIMDRFDMFAQQWEARWTSMKRAAKRRREGGKRRNQGEDHPGKKVKVGSVAGSDVIMLNNRVSTEIIGSGSESRASPRKEEPIRAKIMAPASPSSATSNLNPPATTTFGALSTNASQASDAPTPKVLSPSKANGGLPKFSFSLPTPPTINKGTEEKEKEKDAADKPNDLFTGKDKAPTTSSPSVPGLGGFGTSPLSLPPKATLSFGAQSMASTTKEQPIVSFGASTDTTTTTKDKGPEATVIGSVPAKSPASAFSFDKAPAKDAPLTSAFGGFGASANQPVANKGPAFSFGASTNETSKVAAEPTGGMKFGAMATSAEGSQKETSVASSTATPTLFQFGSKPAAPSLSTPSNPVSKAPSPFSFGGLSGSTTTGKGPIVSFGSTTDTTSTTKDKDQSPEATVTGSESAKSTALGISFDKAPAKDAPPASAFGGFGAPVNQPAAIKAPAFSFGASTNEPSKVATEPTGGMKFGAMTTPAEVTQKETSSPAPGGLFQFGTKSAASSRPTTPNPASKAPSPFSFDKPPAKDVPPTSAFGGFGTSSNQPAANKGPAFSFGASTNEASKVATEPTGELKFGAMVPPAEATTQKETPATSTAPTPTLFQFGTKAPTGSSMSTTPSPATVTPAPFSFGVAAPTAAPTNQAAPGPATGMFSGFGSSSSSSQPIGNTMTSSVTPIPPFSFGQSAPTSVPAPSLPTGGSGFGQSSGSGFGGFGGNAGNNITNGASTMPTATQPAVPNAFGSSTTTSGGSFTFGSGKSAGPSPSFTFGGTTNTQSAAAPSFGFGSTPAPTNPSLSTPSFGFGTANQTTGAAPPAFGAANQTTGAAAPAFGAANQITGAAPPAFGGMNQNAPMATGGFAFGGQGTTNQNPNPPAGGMFAFSNGQSHPAPPSFGFDGNQSGAANSFAPGGMTTNPFAAPTTVNANGSKRVFAKPARRGANRNR